MMKCPTDHQFQFNQELFDFLTNEEEKIQQLSLQNKSKRNNAPSINHKQEYTQKDQRKNTTNTKEWQNIIQDAFFSFTSSLKNNVKLESNTEHERWSNQNNKNDIQQQDEQKQEQINRLKLELQRKDKSIFQMTHNHRLQLTNKDRVIKQLQTKLRKCKTILKQLKTPILDLKQDLQVLKEDCCQKSRFQVEQKKMNELKNILVKKKVEQTEKVNKQKEKAKQQYNHILQDIEHSQRDLSRIVGFTIDQQLTNQNKVKAFYDQLNIYIKYSHAFSDSTIIQNQNQRKWIMQRVSQTIDGNHFKTHMIYRFDSLNKTSFHKYIDGKPNILLIIELINGYKIGGFCKTPIQKQRVDRHKDGFLYSLTLQEKYEPKSSNQALVSYDEFFLLFGNAEVRIKAHETKVFSNFGVNSGVFATYGKKFADFLGSVANEIELSHFEIYEIIQNQI